MPNPSFWNTYYYFEHTGYFFDWQQTSHPLPWTEGWPTREMDVHTCTVCTKKIILAVQWAHSKQQEHQSCIFWLILGIHWGFFGAQYVCCMIFFTLADLVFSGSNRYCTKNICSSFSRYCWTGASINKMKNDEATVMSTIACTTQGSRKDRKTDLLFPAPDQHCRGID